MAGEANRDMAVGAVVGIAVLAAVAIVWFAFGPRPDPPPPDPATAAQRFADAWVAGDRDALLDVLVRNPGRDLDEGLAAFDGVGTGPLAVEVAEVLPGEVENAATAVLVASLPLEGGGTWTWQSQVPLERSRASWRARWDWSAFHPVLAAGVRFEARSSVAPRAPILAFDGTPLTATGEVVTIGIEPRAINDPERLRSQLASLVPEVVEALDRTLARRDLNPGWFYPLDTVPASRLEGIRDRVDTLPGMILRSGEGRVGATDGFGRHLLGRVDDGDGTAVGVGGLEEVFDARLRGGPVVEVLAVEEDGDVRAVVATLREDATEPVVTTLDAAAFEAVENALLGRDDRAAVVLVGPDGGLLAAASRPLAGYHRAFAGAYPPGAAAWPLALYAAVEADLVDTTSRVACPGEVRVGGVRFDNLGGFDLGEVPIDVAVAEGCRTTVARLAGDLPVGALEGLATSLGFGGAPDLPLEVAGSQWPAAKDTAERAAAGVGQGRVLSSLVQLAGIAAAFSDGSWDPVHLVPSEEPAEGVGLVTAAWREARALFDAAGARNRFPAGTGVVSGESTSPEGRLAVVVVVRDDVAGVVLLEGGTRVQALDLARRTLAELDALRSRTTPDG